MVIIALTMKGLLLFIGCLWVLFTRKQPISNEKSPLVEQ